MRHFVSLMVLALVTTFAMGQVTTTFAPALHSFADPQSPIDRARANQLMDLDAGTIRSRDTARTLIELTLKKENPSVDLDADSFYCIINVVRWAERSAGKPRWYVYHAGDNWDTNDFITNKRVFGAKRPWLLVIHLNSPAGYTLSYQITVKHRLPLNVQHLADLATLARAAGQAPGAECTGCQWAAQSIDGDPPSDITITPQISPTDGSRNQNLDDTSTLFDNEGRYHWDVSIGVPIVSYKQLQFNSTAGTVTTQDIDKRNLLALFDFYPKAVDLKGSNYAHSPYFVAGAAMASKPLQKVLIGAGWGPMFANFYGGCMIVTEKDPKDPAGKRNRQRFQAAFGLNLPIRAIAEKLGVKQ